MRNAIFCGYRQVERRNNARVNKAETGFKILVLDGAVAVKKHAPAQLKLQNFGALKQITIGKGIGDIKTLLRIVKAAEYVFALYPVAKVLQRNDIDPAV